MAEAKTKTAAQKAAPKSAAPKKSTAKPAATPKPEAKAKPAAAPKKAAATKAAAPTKKLKPSNEELYHMIQTAAYFIAERNNFKGDSTQYWIEAEAQIKSLLK